MVYLPDIGLQLDKNLHFVYYFIHNVSALIYINKVRLCTVLNHMVIILRCRCAGLL